MEFSIQQEFKSIKSVNTSIDTDVEASLGILMGQSITSHVLCDLFRLLSSSAFTAAH